MKNKKNKVKNIANVLLSVFKGLTVSNPIINMGVGAVQGVAEGLKKNKKNNIESKSCGVGNVDIFRCLGEVLGLGIVVILIVSFIKGWITMSELVQLMEFVPE
jgi:hypothetical protein